ncbi:MAG TPA: tetraacyldisaccharide 4'-kinase [Candidatus Angelobacter sp.]
MSLPASTLLSHIFATGVSVRNALYTRQILPARRLSGAVISIGNLSVGGSGKTPFTIALGELLKARNIKFDVLSRGYGRKTKGVLEVNPSGSSRDFGDEPLLIARRLSVPVIVGEDRYQAGLAAEKKFGTNFHLLDDGFQHRALHRDFDIVLVTPDDSRDRLLPAGRLREPITGLKRADAVALMSGAAKESFPLDGKLVWQVRRGIELQNVPSRPVAFCGIARPQNFFAQLRTAGIELAAEAIYRDHHAYEEKDIQELLQVRQQSEANGFVTTEKDLINLGLHRAALEPLSVIPVKLKILDAANVVDTMLSVIEERRRGREKISVTP